MNITLSQKEWDLGAPCIKSFLEGNNYDFCKHGWEQNNVPSLEMKCKTKNTKQTSWNEFLK